MQTLTAEPELRRPSRLLDLVGEQTGESAGPSQVPGDAGECGWAGVSRLSAEKNKVARCKANGRSRSAEPAGRGPGGGRGRWARGGARPPPSGGGRVSDRAGRGRGHAGELGRGAGGLRGAEGDLSELGGWAWGGGRNRWMLRRTPRVFLSRGITSTFRQEQEPGGKQQPGLTARR